MRGSTLMISIGSIVLAGSTVLVTACHNAPPPGTTTAQPTEAQLARTRDSLETVRKAAADSIERARVVMVAAQARADSIEQARLARLAAARRVADEAAEKNTQLRQELGVMVHFDAAKSSLSEDDRDALDRKVTILNANPDVRLQITGACDERGSDTYNMALGQRRAASVKRYLVGKGIVASRLDPMSSGEKSPIDTGSTEAAWVQNRRAEFVVVSSSATLSMK
jgi:peptidoglycan-associated lipoprotein